MKIHRELNIVNASIYMHFVNYLSSKASIRARINNVDVTEHRSALCQIKGLLDDNSELHSCERLQA